MCNTKCCNDGCHEEDIMCCAPLMHCCGGYSEHNNCCPHDRCCNQCCGCHGHIPCCGDCCNKCNCICPCIKKAIKDTKDELDKNINTLESRVIRDEDQHEQDILNLTNELGELNDNLEKEIADRIQDVDEEEARAKAAENSLNNKIDKEIADRKDEAIADAQYINNSGDAYIKFINANGEEVRRIDAKPFIKDGLLNDVKLVDDPSNPGDKALRFIFNTDSGKQDIYVPVGDIFEYDDYYTKTQIDAKESALNNAISAEATARQQADTALDGKIATEKSRAQGAEQTLQDNIDAETAARQQADTTLQSNINSEKTARQQAYADLDDKITAEKTRAQGVEQTLQQADATLDSKITAEKTRAEGAEASLNNSKADKATTLAGYGITNAYTKTETDALLDGKQNAINDLSTIRSGAAAGATALQPGDAFDGASKSGNTITFTKNGGSPFTFTLPDISDAGSQTINVGGTQVTIEQAINNLANQISNLGTQITTLQNSILWQIDQTDSTKIVAKNNRGAIAAGFFDSTVS